MLFGTAAFFFAFLPVVFAAFFLLGRWSRQVAAAWLFLASVFFYGYWMPEFTLLLLGSLTLNFFVGARIGRARAASGAPAGVAAKRWMIAGVAMNLALLAWFKYAGFLVGTVNELAGTSWSLGHIILPIGISFYTFTQIAFLADAYKEGVTEYKYAHYGLFVTYFPHLIAGPVLHHAQMMPQFGDAKTYRIDATNIAAGLAVFALGLAKKIVIADGISPFADAVFDAADAGMIPLSSEAWLASLAYAFQLYFDFSGYTDMALGLSLLFNIRLPFNFNSPYKAANISDFWRRWHMTLSKFLRDYLYVPLGGNRKGATRRYANLMITMLLGGLWHGASWSFVFWGGLHGFYLVVHHAYQKLLGARAEALGRNFVYRAACVALTFLAVLVAWIYFRSHTFAGAGRIIAALAQPGTFESPSGLQPLFWNSGLSVGRGWLFCAVAAALAFFAPNSNRCGEALGAVCRRNPAIRFATIGAALTLAVFLISVNEIRGAVSAFIYFNF
jgi:alginate O-acetyltransferase complex protein AlgI